MWLGVQVGVTDKQEALAAASAGADALLIKEDCLLTLTKSGVAVGAFLDELCDALMDD